VIDRTTRHVEGWCSGTVVGAFKGGWVERLAFCLAGSSYLTSLLFSCLLFSYLLFSCELTRPTKRLDVCAVTRGMGKTEEGTLIW